MDTNGEMQIERFHFIVNPIAGSGNGKKVFEAAAERLRAAGISFGYHMTEHHGHATELAGKALALGRRCIVAVGGDGTLREVAGALVDTDAVMGILPAGSGNDLCKSIGIENDLEAAMKVLLDGNVRRMDAGMANDKLFFNVAGLGFDVEVLIRTETYKKRLNGMLPYALGIVSALAHRRPMHLRYVQDGVAHTLDSDIFSLGNGRYIGGGMKALPFADPFDGKLDVSAVESMPFLRFVRLLPKFIKGKHTEAKEVRYSNAVEVLVESDEEWVVELDGELIEKTPVRFRLLPGALKVLAPEA